MVNCSYCKKGISTISNRALHRFPLSDSVLMQKWLANMGLNNGWVPTKNTRLCSDHFTSECYDTDPSSRRRTLRKGTVPTIFAEFVGQCAYCKIPTVEANSGANKKAFHKFPISTPNTFEKWLRNMGLQEWYLTDESVLCSDHFEESCYRVARGYKVLRDGSIPTIFPKVNAMECVPSATEIVQGRSPVRCSTEKELYAEALDLNATEVTVSPPPPFDEVAKEFEQSKPSCDTSIICPNCNYKFGARLCSEHPKRKIPVTVEEDVAKRPRGECAVETSESFASVIEVGHDIMLQEESVPEPSISLSPAAHVGTGIKTPNSKVKRKQLLHDHHYSYSPSTAKRKMQFLYESNKKLQRSLRLERQRSDRMKKKITSLQEVVSELRRTRTLPESSLDCLDSMAETDVSQFLKRYLKNANNQVTGQATVKSKKRLFKPQRDKCKKKSEGPSRAHEFFRQSAPFTSIYLP